MTIMLVTLVAIMGQVPVQPVRPSVLDKSGSNRLLHDAEKQLVAYRLRRLDKSLHHTRTLRPRPDEAAARRFKNSKMVEHRGNPLTGQSCEFSCKFEITVLATDMIRKRSDSSEFVPTPPARSKHNAQSDQYVIVATINARMEGLYKFGDFYSVELARLDQKLERTRADLKRAKGNRGNQQGWIEDRKRNLKKAQKKRTETIKAFKGQVATLRHTVHLILPPQYRPSTKMPRYFDAVFEIESVQFNSSDFLPTFTLYGKLLRSKKLGFEPAATIPNRP